MTDERADPSRAAAAALNGVGPFFEVELLTPGVVPDPSWRPFSDWVTDPDVMTERVARVRLALATSYGSGEVEERVAASTAQFGLVARIVALAIGFSAVSPSGIDLDARRLWWRYAPSGQLDIGASPTSAPFDGRLADTAIEAITQTVSDRFAVAPRVVWGNVGSAANSAAALLAAAQPDRAARARELADAVLTDPRLDGGRLHTGPGFRRQSCCLIYRAGGGREALCGDCVLLATP